MSKVTKILSTIVANCKKSKAQMQAVECGAIYYAIYTPAADMIKVLAQWDGQRSTNGHPNHIKATTKGCIAQPQNLISIDQGVWPEKP